MFGLCRFNVAHLSVGFPENSANFAYSAFLHGENYRRYFSSTICIISKCPELISLFISFLTCFPRDMVLALLCVLMVNGLVFFVF